MGMIWRVFKRLAEPGEVLPPNVIPARREASNPDPEVVSRRFRVALTRAPE
jgi:hypothetical protein